MITIRVLTGSVAATEQYGDASSAVARIYSLYKADLAVVTHHATKLHIIGFQGDDANIGKVAFFAGRLFKGDAVEKLRNDVNALIGTAETVDDYRIRTGK